MLYVVPISHRIDFMSKIDFKYSNSVNLISSVNIFEILGVKLYSLLEDLVRIHFEQKLIMGYISISSIYTQQF